ncbi:MULTISPECIES: peptidoglycan-binding protein [unclassified Rhizobium]
MPDPRQRQGIRGCCHKFLDNKNIGQNVFDASDSVVFNCGADALAWKWAATMKSGDYKTAATLPATTATTQNGKTLAGLVARRKDEANLLVNGIYASGGTATMPSQAQVDAMSDGILRRGERGAAVADLQNRLTLVGYSFSKPDGIFGYGTEAAVLAFQKGFKLTADGQAGPKTFAAVQVVHLWAALLNAHGCGAGRPYSLRWASATSPSSTSWYSALTRRCSGISSTVPSC